MFRVVAGVASVALLSVACGAQDSAPDEPQDVTSSPVQPEICDPQVSVVGDGVTDSELFRYDCGVDPDAEAGVVVYLHGDGAGEFRYLTGVLGEMARVANARGMELIAPASPDTDDGTTWWRDLDANVAWLRGVIAEEVPAGVPVWWVGYSGGAEMISYGLLTEAPELVTGGALMMAGGGVDAATARAVADRADAASAVADSVDADNADGADSTVAAGEASPTESADAAVPVDHSVPLRWAVGSLDDGTTSDDGFDALDAARRGARFWRDVGYTDSRLQVIAGEDHGDFPHPYLVAALLDGRTGSGTDSGTRSGTDGAAGN